MKKTFKLSVLLLCFLMLFASCDPNAGKPADGGKPDTEVVDPNKPDTKPEDQTKPEEQVKPEMNPILKDIEGELNSDGTFTMKSGVVLDKNGFVAGKFNEKGNLVNPDGSIVEKSAADTDSQNRPNDQGYQEMMLIQLLVQKVDPNMPIPEEYKLPADKYKSNDEGLLVLSESLRLEDMKLTLLDLVYQPMKDDDCTVKMVAVFKLDGDETKHIVHFFNENNVTEEHTDPEIYVNLGFVYDGRVYLEHPRGPVHELKNPSLEGIDGTVGIDGSLTFKSGIRLSPDGFLGSELNPDGSITTDNGVVKPGRDANKTEQALVPVLGTIAGDPNTYCEKLGLNYVVDPNTGIGKLQEPTVFKSTLVGGNQVFDIHLYDLMFHARMDGQDLFAVYSIDDESSKHVLNAKVVFNDTEFGIECFVFDGEVLNPDSFVF